MTSKRQRGESSKSTPSFDRTRFVSSTAAQRYHKHLSDRNLIPERGLIPDPTEDGDMAAMIRARNWQLFTSQPEPAAVNVVKEFYANAKEPRGNSVFVRGKWVNVGRKAINAYYGLQKINLSDYEEYLELNLDYSEIIASLCEPGTDWKATSTNEAVNFSHSKLSRYGKAWYGFMCAKLMPTRHKTDVTKERAALLYCIVLEKSIDVGAIIHESIVQAIDSKTSKGMPHPSLISELCKQAGVRWDKEEVFQVPGKPINHKVIARYKVWPQGFSHPKGLGFIRQMLAPDTTVAPLSNSEGSVNPDISQQLRELQNRMDRQNRQIALRQDETHAYNTNFNTALLVYFQRLNPSVELGQFPGPSTLSAYPPPNEDDTAAPDSEDSDDQGSPQF